MIPSLLQETRINTRLNIGDADLLVSGVLDLEAKVAAFHVVNLTPTR